jgi:hypothetical protein
MRTADELFNQYNNTHPAIGQFLGREMFKAVIAEHDADIKELIHNMIKGNERGIEQLGYRYAHEQRIAVLKELGTKL